MKNYKSIITLNKNSRGIWDLDTTKGCGSGVANDEKGCYGDCYAARSARIYGFNFSTTVLRDFENKKHEIQLVNKINKIDMSFIRIGVMGDPSENWEHTFNILEKIKRANKEIVIITKHWNIIPNEYLQKLFDLKVCINTSVSALDDIQQLEKVLFEYNRLKPYCKSFLRIVSCDFNLENEKGVLLSEIQKKLFKNDNTIDTVFRCSPKNKFVLEGVINIKKTKFLGSPCWVSKFNKKAYFGKCSTCKEQCGIFNDKIRRFPSFVQGKLF